MFQLYFLCVLITPLKPTLGKEELGLMGAASSELCRPVRHLITTNWQRDNNRIRSERGSSYSSGLTAQLGQFNRGPRSLINTLSTAA